LFSIHSPPFLHLEHVRLATASGRHVLCDKPFGCNATEAREMLNLATRAGVLHFLDFEFRCHPAHVKAKEMLDGGAIGAPLHGTWTTLLSYGRQMPYRWLHDKDKGGGWVGAFGSHAVDFFRWMFGDIVAAGGQLRTDLKMRRDRDTSSDRKHLCTADDAFTAWVRMENGVTATIDSAYSTGATFPQQVRIIGSEGALQINDMSELLVIRPERESERHIFASKDPDPHQPRHNSLAHQSLRCRCARATDHPGLQCRARLRQGSRHFARHGPDVSGPLLGGHQRCPQPRFAFSPYILEVRAN
jgi:predicted dehydrogenase